MGSDDGGLGGCCFDSGPGVGGSKLLLLTSWPVRLRKMNRSFRDSFVIFFLFGVLVEGELYCSMFNIASLSQKKIASGHCLRHLTSVVYDLGLDFCKEI